MRHVKKGFVLGVLGLLISTPGWAQQCTSNANAAVECFLKNGVSTGLLVLPKGMTMNQYQSYGVAVSKVLQSPSAAIFLLGMAGAASDAIPPTNANGTPNQAAQDGYVDAIVAAGLKDEIIQLPPQTTSSQLEQFARELTAGMTGNPGVTISPGAFLRTIDGFIVASTSSSGTVNWVQVTSNITSLVGVLQTAGLVKLPASITIANVEQFALDVATAIEQYKQTTGKAHL